MMTKDRVFMQIARELSQLGTCDRKHVGAVIIREGRCISWGYNGAPAGMPHCEANSHGYSYLGLYETVEGAADQRGCRNATHAEANALAFAARQGISTDGGELYVTVSPCDVCARLLIAAGIVKVHFDETYRDQSGLDWLRAAHIPCHES